ncbi:DegT/DnrJ/EryC1/StrS family aminotransferase [Pontibacter sp. BT310]|uniref:DegT/DnrJ/EryC1/StrS family aminotransferase n=1 Tax=Pontibacter populi TaxID=890055 RepID=A0ABS6XF69_9BACT|nr:MULTISPECIES: DegT/DnrJ/EryC1/StrS family aminotransferase [Pontibacter]MBJ6119785.1 DegT/DnrJ/EryC1/StrS family aminotransferase [Pontibacter sp. BT310]MBR0572214.1 DegT/DnrJ/EryC1/StrS family aminotransferase [Microvirga sp. STS03]MBW3366638.1 DegT/DnrJ/EryC1/StrS family aminotransferase [Pontibacter populi]
MIPVTKPFLPPKEEYDYYVNGIWKRQWLTNNGPLVNELELKLKEYLDLKHLLYVTNGTIAIQLAIKALNIKGEIITTPFSYVATTSSIVWEGCEPVFVDINKDTLNIDPDKIEDAITPRTSAILATHVFGNPCEIDAIQNMANKYGLKVIYDAAHCFGVLYKNRSIFEFGDICTTSFHATKLFHTIEGGAIFTKDADLLRILAMQRNFGHAGPENFEGLGINGKNSEFHAAMGLVNLPYINDIIKRRMDLCNHYDSRLKGIHKARPTLNSDCLYNYAYYPILLNSEEVLNQFIEKLNAHWIYPRRYFYPSLNTLPYVKRQAVPIADDIAKRILCLPLYHDLSFEEIDMIARILLRVQNN